MLTSPRVISGLTTRSTVGKRSALSELLMLPDGSDSRLRRLSYRGPGAVLIQVEHERQGVRERGRVGIARSHATVRVAGAARTRHVERGQVIALGRGGRLLVVPSAVEARP